MPYLYNIYDTISIRDGKVGVGTETPSELFHVQGGSIYVERMTNAASNIDFAYSTLSNIKSVKTDTLTSATGTHINVDGKTLSNVSTLRVQTLTPETGDVIDVNNKQLSNVNTLSVLNLTSDVSHIDVNQKTLSNVNTLRVQTLTPESGNTINVNNMQLSNVNTLSVLNLTSDASHIDVNFKTLSNVANMRVNSLQPESGSFINMNSTFLSNVDKVSLNILTSDLAYIDVNNKSFCNIGSMNVGTMYASSIDSSTGTISFSGDTLSNIAEIVTIGDTRIGGTLYASNLNVWGTFTTLETTTSNTDQFTVTNDGTGPALVVTQTGPEPIAVFYDDANVALKIDNGGLVGINTDSPTSMLHIYENADNAADLRLTSLAGDDLVFSSNAGTYQIVSDIPLTLGATSEAVRITTGGNVGVGTSSDLYKLDIAGTTRVQNALYLRTGGMNTISYSYGGHTFSSGNGHIGMRLAWASSSADQKMIFRTCVKCHLAYATGVAYRKFESLITPVDNTSDRPGQIIATEVADTNDTAVETITHAVERVSATSVDIKIQWTSSLSDYVGNVQMEVFANATLGDFTFTPIYSA